jgi:pantoate--beta-alanine ligase
LQLVRSRIEMQQVAAHLRDAGHRIGFVPTMGALHAGHISLLDHVRDCDRIIVSIFVNPIQFGPGEDLERYPRDLDADCEQLRAAGCHLVFAPAAADMYGPAAHTRVVVEELEDVLCGASRPGHFRGVATIVSKLFHIVQPHVAVFGQKDAQQALVLRRMSDDLDFGVQIRVAPIVRDPDGLALSSRNAYLSAEERPEALLLHESLCRARSLIEGGERDAERVRARMRSVLARGAALQVDYVDIVETTTLRAVRTLQGRFLVAVAAVLGSTRLIDNVVLEVRDAETYEVSLDAPHPHIKPGRSNATT